MQLQVADRQEGPAVSVHLWGDLFCVGSYNIIEVRKGDGQGKWQVVGQEKSIEGFGEET